MLHSLGGLAKRSALACYVGLKGGTSTSPAPHTHTHALTEIRGVAEFGEGRNQVPLDFHMPWRVSEP